MSLAAVRNLREVRAGAGPEELVDFETDVLAGFVLARAAAGLPDGTISSDVLHVEQVRAWLGGRCGRWIAAAVLDLCARLGKPAEGTTA